MGLTGMVREWGSAQRAAMYRHYFPSSWRGLVAVPWVSLQNVYNMIQNYEMYENSYWRRHSEKSEKEDERRGKRSAEKIGQG